MRSYPFIIRVIVIACIAFVLFETLARLSGRIGPRFRLDSELGWVSRKAESEQHHSQEGARKILILGDCFIYREEVTEEQRFDRVMQGLSHQDAITVLGVSGYSTDQELMAAIRELNNLRAGLF